ncbi:CPBP family intramembrane metalloprotease [Bacteroidales bacterium OttesenSCG-928-I14]|nr:CPBP family intramembrane metalloprotease [Bacteroidales bacterium OttesenSCG-928-I14]
MVKTIIKTLGLLLFPIPLITILMGTFLWLQKEGIFPRSSTSIAGIIIDIFVLSVYLFLLYRLNLFSLIKIKPPTIWKLIIYLIIAFVLYGIHNYFKYDNGFFQLNISNYPWTKWISTLLIAPVLEEITFRGIGIEYMKRHNFSNWVIVLLTSFIFGIFHVPSLFGLESISLWDIEVFVFPILLALIYMKERNLIYCIFIHSLWNLLVYLF